MRVELAGRVRVQAGEEQEALAADLHHGVLGQRRLGATVLEQGTNALLMSFSLGEVLAVELGKLRMTRRVGRSAQLREGLHLDRMCICQVLGELF